MDPIKRALQNNNFPPKKSDENLDRFIPNRSATNFDYAKTVLRGGWKTKKTLGISSPSKQAYQKKLREVFNMENPRIFAYKNKPPAPVEYWPQDSYAVVKPSNRVKHQRHIRPTADRILDAPDILDDFYVNVLDWGSSNVLAIALGPTIHLWNDANTSVSQLCTVDDDTEPVTSVSWAPDGQHIAVGLNNSKVQLWNTATIQKVRTLRGGHHGRVGALAWNQSILTRGSQDSSIFSHDVRARSSIVAAYQGHQGEICALKWSSSGVQLASGGNDNLLYIWDRSLASSNSVHDQWLHRLEDHRAAVRALAWCPFQSNLLASGGGAADGCIKFWNTHTGACLNSVDTRSQVCALLWSKNDRELLSSHGLPQNQLTLWKYPSMVKIAELSGHISRPLYMAQSPDAVTVASAAGDETLRFWKVFEDSATAKSAPKVAAEPFANACLIR